MQPIDSIFSVPPFPAFPSITRYVPIGSLQEAFERVCRSIDAREAISLVLGPPGTGKSLLCSLLANHFRASHDVALVGETPIQDSAAFQRHLLHHLGAKIESIPDGDLQLALVDRVCDPNAPAGGLLVIVDEAQSLSPEVIESIRMVTNIMRKGEPRVHAVLCGGVKLEETLIASSMEAFTQRVATRCYLHAMNGEESRRYISETIRACGAESDNTITGEAIAAVHHACMGVPRLINQIMTEAIDCAEEAGQELINEQVIDQAWARLQQLPSPMVEEPKLAGHAAPVEFGELDDADVNSIEHDVNSIERDVNSIEHDVQCQSGESESDECQKHPSLPAESSIPLSDQVTDRGSFGFDQDIQIDSEIAECQLESELLSNSFQQPQVEQQIQSVDPSNRRVLPAVLFGDFEVEEEVIIGNGVAAASQNARGESPNELPPPPNDLESVLHQEIIGISSLAASGIDCYQETEFESNSANDSGVELDEEPQEVVEDLIVEDAECEPDSEQEPEARHDTEPELEIESDLDTETELEDRESPATIVWMTEAEDGRVIHDDSDLLVIEDEVELTRNDTVKRIDSHDQTISVDFQTMLSRMRTRV